MSGWEKCAHPAELAVAVLQGRRGNGMYVHHFMSRWGPEVMWELVFSGVLQYQARFGGGERVCLAPEFCAPEREQAAIRGGLGCD